MRYRRCYRRGYKMRKLMHKLWNKVALVWDENVIEDAEDFCMTSPPKVAYNEHMVNTLQYHCDRYHYSPCQWTYISIEPHRYMQPTRDLQGRYRISRCMPTRQLNKNMAIGVQRGSLRLDCLGLPLTRWALLKRREDTSIRRFERHIDLGMDRAW